MTTVVRPLVALLGALALLLLGTTPAHADNPQISQGPSSARYTDLTDKLCARIAPSARGGYAEALILNSSGRIVERKSDRWKAGDTGWTCTGNLSIPEDVRYTLVVSDCGTGPTPACSSNRTTFFS